MDVIKNNTSCVLCSNTRIQYKCMICYNYDLCTACHRKSKDPYEPNEHSINHPMQLIKTGLDYSVCRSCQTTDFRGSRYKCMICRDFDFCADCHRHRASTEHNSLHPMECIEKESSKGLFCDLCNKRNYLGNQFKCLVCHNFYLCFDCHNEMKLTNHSDSHTQNHPMQILKESIDVKANGSQVTSSCNSCTVQNFRGVRFKCMVCRDYDLCSECRRCSQHIAHNASHPMQYIPSTLNGTRNRKKKTKNVNSRDSPSDELSETTADEGATACEGAAQREHSEESLLYGNKKKTIKIKEETKRERLESNESSNGASNVNKEQISSTLSNSKRKTNDGSPSDKCKTENCNSIGKEAFRGYCYACVRVLSRQELEPTNMTEKRVFLPTNQEAEKRIFLPTKQNLHKQQKQAAKRGACSKHCTRVQKVKDTPPQQPFQDQEKNLCLVCLEEPYNTVLLPCGHVWLCYACAQTLMVTTKTCPACRTHVDSFHRVYMGH